MRKLTVVIAFIMHISLPIAFIAAFPSHYHSCTLNLSGGERLSYPFCNVSLSLDDRISDLLSRLTYQEKCAALDTRPPTIKRLGVASMKSGESTHGVSCGCGTPASSNSTGCPTSFPTGTGLGASFDRDLWDIVGQVIGTEARGLNNQGKSELYFLDPNINLCRDPRWGRCQEVPGEDPFLTAEYAVHLIVSTQEGKLDSRYMQAAATAKHFSMYDLEGYIPRTDPQPHPPSGSCDTPGGCERFNFNMMPPTEDFVDYYLVPFQEAIQRARPQSIMCSYNAAFGKPTCADGTANNDLVRGSWGFDGFFVSDCTALELFQDVKWDKCKHPYPSEGGHCTPESFPGGHNYTQTVAETIHTALVTGGIDYNCGALYKTNLYSQLLAGSVTKADVDQAAGRVYKTQFRLGMLDPPDHQPYILNLGSKDVDSAFSRAAALRAARESLVLLKNDKSLLPIDQKIGNVAFIGPHANATQTMLGNYHGQNKLVNTHSPLQVALSRSLNVTYAQGCRICDYPYGKNPGFPNQPCPVGHDQNTSGIHDAVKVAQEADVAVVFVGMDQTSEAENFDRNNLIFPGVQEQLVRQVVAVQPNTVIVLIHGGPISSEVFNDIPAVLDAFYPGELGGDAIVDALFGAYSPAGKLPYTIYYSNFTSRDIRETDLRENGGITYRWFQGPVMWPFGFGLSYTSFSFDWKADAYNVFRNYYDAKNDLLLNNTIINHTVIVTNTGSRASDCVVTAFITTATRDSAPKGMPLRKLYNFTRLFDVHPGESRTVTFATDLQALVFADKIGRRIIAPGKVIIEVGDIIHPAKHEFMIVLNDDDVLVVDENLWARTFFKR